jgi:hypothetical protein
VFAGDAVTLNNPTSGTYDTKNVGTGKTVSVTGLAVSGTDSGNYQLASTTTSRAVGTIAPLSITAGLTGSVVKTYDGTTAGALTGANFVLSGTIGGDVVSVGPVAGSFDTKNVGTGKTVTTAGFALTGADAGNYNLTTASVGAPIGTINKAPLSVTANDATSIISQPLPPFSASYSGFVNGEGTGVLGGTLLFSTPATASSPPGQFPITPSGLTAQNYAIAFLPGTLTITNPFSPNSGGTGGGSAGLGTVATAPVLPGYYFLAPYPTLYAGSVSSEGGGAPAGGNWLFFDSSLKRGAVASAGGA